MLTHLAAARPETIRALTGVSDNQLTHLVRLVAPFEPPRRGRPWGLRRLDHRVLLTAVWLRTSLTTRELAALSGISQSAVCRVLDCDVPMLAALLEPTVDRRFSWTVDGTLAPTWDHTRAGSSKNYRWSTNAQVLARRRDLRVVWVDGGGPGNRGRPRPRGTARGSSNSASSTDACSPTAAAAASGELATPRFQGRGILRDEAYRAHRRRRARAEHAIARMKDWRALREHRRTGDRVVDSLRAVAVLHNTKLDITP